MADNIQQTLHYQVLFSDDPEHYLSRFSPRQVYYQRIRFRIHQHFQCFLLPYMHCYTLVQSQYLSYYVLCPFRQLHTPQDLLRAGNQTYDLYLYVLVFQLIHRVCSSGYPHFQMQEEVRSQTMTYVHLSPSCPEIHPEFHEFCEASPHPFSLSDICNNFYNSQIQD